jgi:hypothetical protein
MVIIFEEFSIVFEELLASAEDLTVVEISGFTCCDHSPVELH